MDAAGHESVSHELPSPARESRVPHRFQLILVWAVWGAMTLAAILYIRHYTRNIPFADDFALIPMMTGHEPVSLRWAWSQHNEHRPVLSRLILAGLSRYVKNDFRSGRYFNAGLVSMAAASMLLLARRLRGRTILTDAVLPLSILNIGQAEILLMGFAMNLVLSAWMSFELIAAAGLADRRGGWPLVRSASQPRPISRPVCVMARPSARLKGRWSGA